MLPACRIGNWAPEATLPVRALIRTKVCALRTARSADLLEENVFRSAASDRKGCPTANPEEML
jgi:hypothetical protein